MLNDVLSGMTAAILAAAAASSAAGAQAGDGTDSATIQALLACREIAEPAARTACLETRLDEFATALDEGRLVVVERTRLREVERESFGVSLPGVSSLASLFGGSGGATGTPSVEALPGGGEAVYDESGRLDALRAIPVERIDTARDGKMIVTLANGQVWYQIDTVTARVPRSRREGLTASIRAGAIGSHFMEFSYPGRAFRVRRIE